MNEQTGKDRNKTSVGVRWLISVDRRACLGKRQELQDLALLKAIFSRTKRSQRPLEGFCSKLLKQIQEDSSLNFSSFPFNNATYLRCTFPG